MKLEPTCAPAFITRPPCRVLFLCVHNSARSQMAEGFARAQGAGRGSKIWSAGSELARVHPMADGGHERGRDRHRRPALAGDRRRAVAVRPTPWCTLCGEAEERCPVLEPGVRRCTWPLPDPSAAPEPERLQAFRTARDEIRWRVASLWPSVEDSSAACAGACCDESAPALVPLRRLGPRRAARAVTAGLRLWTERARTRFTSWALPDDRAGCAGGATWAPISGMRRHAVARQRRRPAR